MGKLDGKVAVITGATSGMALAGAKLFVDEGAHVFITGRRKDALDEAVKSIGRNVTGVQADSADLDDLDRLFQTVQQEKGAIDVLWASSGGGEQGRLGDVTEGQFDATFSLNARGTLFTVQKALPLMRHGGSIILTGSSAGTTGAPGFSAYSASKAAVRNLARSWAEDLKGTGIRVNVLSPGPTATELAKEALGAEGMQVFASMNPLKRMADPAEIGAAAAFLASQDSSFMTASEVAVDGGLAQI